MMIQRMNIIKNVVIFLIFISFFLNPVFSFSVSFESDEVGNGFNIGDEVCVSTSKIYEFVLIADNRSERININLSFNESTPFRISEGFVELNSFEVKNFSLIFFSSNEGMFLNELIFKTNESSIGLPLNFLVKNCEDNGLSFIIKDKIFFHSKNFIKIIGEDLNFSNKFFTILKRQSLGNLFLFSFLFFFMSIILVFSFWNVLKKLFSLFFKFLVKVFSLFRDLFKRG